MHDTLTKEALGAALDTEQKSQLIHLGHLADQMHEKKQSEQSELEQLREIISHNAVVTNKLVEELSQNLLIANLVINEVIRLTGISHDEVVQAAQDAYVQVTREDVEGDHPAEATVFGGQ
jgi:hypothetical protein